MNEKLKLNSKRGGAAFLVIVIVMLLLIVAVLGGIVTYLVKNNQGSNNGSFNGNENNESTEYLIKAEIEKGYANLMEQLNAEYVDVEFEAAIQGENLSSVGAEKLAKCYNSAIESTNFIPVTEILSEKNKTAICKLEVADQTLYVQVEIKSDGSYSLSKVDNYVENENNVDEEKDVNNNAGKDGYIYDAKYPYTVSSESYKTYFSTYYVKDIVVPYINLDSEDASKANKEIKEIFNKAIDTYKLGLTDKTTYVKMCEYTHTLNKNILSVVVTLGIGGTDVVRPEYYTYNFDVNTGKLLSYEDIYKVAGFDEGTIFNGVNKIIKKNVEDVFINGMGVTKNMDTYYAMSMHNYQKSIRQNSLGYYLDKNGKLNIVTDIFVPAGTGRSTRVMAVEYDKNFEIPEIMRIVYKNMTVPYINLDSQDVFEANNEIREVLLKALKAQNDNIATVKICDYKYTLNNKNLFVLVTLAIGGTDVPEVEHYTFNVNVETGNKLSYAEVYKLAGFNETNIDSKVESIITKIMKEELNGASYPEGKNEDTYINSTINNYRKSKDNNTLKYYIDSDNKLNVVVTLDIPAGREHFNRLITID